MISAPTASGQPSRNATTTPGRMVWAIASPRKAMPRSTIYVPRMEQTMPTMTDAARAR